MFSDYKKGKFPKFLSLVLTLSFFIQGLVFMPLKAAAATATIFSDGFEAPTGLDNWTEDGWSSSASGHHSGQKSAYLVGANNTQTMSTTTSTIGKENIKLSYWYKADSLEIASESPSHHYDVVRVYYTVDGSTWTEFPWSKIDDNDDDNHWHQYTFSAFPDSANNNLNFAVKFDGDLSSGSDKVWIDDFELTGDEVVVSTPTEETETVVVKLADLATGFADVIANPTKWFFYNDETDVIDNTLGSFVDGPDTAPLGEGSAQISVTGTERRNLATYQFSGTPLASITDLKFSTYNPSAGNGGSTNRSAYINFNVDFDGTDSWQKRLVFLPQDNGTIVQNSWQEWDAIGDGSTLWRYSGTTWPNTGESGTTPKTWNQILTDYPGVRVRVSDSWFGMRVGEPYADGYTENMDKFVFGTSTKVTTFDFEPTEGPQCTESDLAVVSDENVSIESGFAAPLTFIHENWTATIPGAKWIWTEDPISDTEHEVMGYFYKDFTVNGGPLTANLAFASDNSYRVVINGEEVASTTEEVNFYNVTNIDVLSKIHSGNNKIEFWVDNFARSGTDYTSNPAGLLFKLDVHSEDCGGEPVDPGKSKVYITKYLNGAPAIEGDGTFYAKLSGTQEAELPLGPSVYEQISVELVNGDNTVQVEEKTTAFDSNMSVVSSFEECVAGKSYMVGYTYGNSYAAAANSSSTTTVPLVLNDITSDQYVIIWNQACPAGNIKIINKVIPSDSSKWNMGIDSAYTTWEQFVGDGYDSGFVPVEPGEHNVVGQTSPGTSGLVYDSTVECKSGDSVVASNGPMSLAYGVNLGSHQFQVADGEEVTCTFTHVLKESGNNDEDNNGGGDEIVGPNTLQSIGNQGGRRRDISGLVSGGEVLGASTEDLLCEPYLNSYIKYGAQNDPEEVKKLQMFLNQFFEVNNPVTGFYGQITYNMVRKFQEHQDDAVLTPWQIAGFPTDGPTGYVYKTTQRWINILKCPEMIVNSPFPRLP